MGGPECRDSFRPRWRATTDLEVLLVASDVVLHQEELLLHEAAVLVVQVLQQHLVQNHGEVQVLGGPLPEAHHTERVRSSWVPMWWSTVDQFEKHMSHRGLISSVILIVKAHYIMIL